MSLGGVALGTLPLSPFYYSISDQSESFLTFNMTAATLQVTNRTLFSDLVSQILLTPAASVSLDGLVNAMVHTQLGDIVISGILFKGQEVQFIGILNSKILKYFDRD